MADVITMNSGMTPPDGELVDASGFWASRNVPAAGESAAPEPDVAEPAASELEPVRPDPPVSGGWVRYRDYLPKERVPRPLGFKRLLVANRGEIACRVFRTARDLGLETVAVFSDPDRNSAHVRDADVAVALGGTTSTESYLDTSKILDAARRAGADAIHPGYGFLSENPDFAQAVMDAGITWVGPSPDSIRAMALKVEAKRLALAAGVPLVPGAELSTDLTHEELAGTAEAVGYPLLVKASAGGGGKGMRAVAGPEDLLEAVEGARREAMSSFGDPTVFLERYLTGARHVEVQVFGDAHGNFVHLFERECSIQRRHQKIVEESPSPGTNPATLERMYESAVALARQIGYVGAGTVEFLVFGEGDLQEFFFLEMNTRLQVEHPVTEAVTGLNLVQWQLRVANGDELPTIQSEISRNGHAIEVRLYAEDPANNYLPSTGRLEAFGVDSAAEGYCREDSGFASGDEVTSFYDPLLAKIISHASDREDAIRKLTENLRLREIAGVITNRDLLVAILDSPEFVAAATTTDFLELRAELLGAQTMTEAERDRLLIAATLASQWLAEQSAPWADITHGGWRNITAVPQRTDWLLEGGAEPVSIAAVWAPTGSSTGSIELRQSQPEAGFSGPVGGLEYRVHATLRAGRNSVDLRLELDGIVRNFIVTSGGDCVWVADGRNCVTFRCIPRFVDPDLVSAGGGPAAPVPGTVVSVEVAVGDDVAEGQTLVVIEAMKMEHRITAEADGVVGEVLVTAGDSVDAHQILVTFE